MMTQNFSRRQFLATSGAAMTLAGATGALAPKAVLAKESLMPASDHRSLFDISLAEWSLHRALQSGKIDNLDFPVIAKEEFGIDGVEYVNQFFKDKAKDAKYLGELKKRCDDNEVKSLLIMVDGEGQLGDADSKKRTEAVENHFPWVAAAKFLGCHSIRVNAGSSGSYQEQVELATDGLRRLSEHAAPVGINVIVENHGGYSSNGQWLAQVIRKVDMDNCGTLPDFGNFRIKNDQQGNEVWYDRYLGVAALMPFAKAVSAKSHDFDENGNEKKTDFMKMLQIVIDAGYHGYIGVEYEGGGLDEYEGVKATKRLLEKCREQLASSDSNQ
jgi:L-ribulose-5-phosphate 3-epimerase